MIRFRPFLNSDPPEIAAIWRSQPPGTALMQPMTAATLDDRVLAKPYFDRQGLIVAISDERVVGFVHAGFGCTDDRGQLDHSQGVTSLLMTLGADGEPALWQGLLEQSEQYLRSRGATTMFGGATDTLAPFYLGIYGGSQLPGVLASDQPVVQAFRAAGYLESTHCRCWRCDLTHFRPPVDRDLMQARRRLQVAQGADVVPGNWWEAAQFACVERFRFQLSSKTPPTLLGEATFWDIEPLASSWGVHATGLLQVGPVDHDLVQLTYFLGETLRLLRTYGVVRAELQTHAGEEMLAQACQKLGFSEVDQGLLFRKPD